jgi:uncharacterized protein (TIGR03083 family)
MSVVESAATRITQFSSTASGVRWLIVDEVMKDLADGSFDRSAGDVSVDVWVATQAERADLVDALAALPADAWGRPSLCEGWTVRQVVAHMIATASMTPPAFVGKLVRTGFHFDAMSQREIDRIAEGATDADLVAAFRARIGSRSAPPGPATTWLGETIVHGEDIFRALGSYRQHPLEHLVAVADFYAGSNLLIGAKKRIDGVTLRASDADWTHGSGPEVRGPLVALVLAMTGRKAALDDLEGEGVTVLRDRS